MVYIRNNDNVDREDDRRADREREKSRRDLENRSQRKSMQTFEAKLSEKNAAEFANKEAENQKETLLKNRGEREKDKASLIDRLISKAKPQEMEQQKRREEIKKRQSLKEKEHFEEVVEQEHFQGAKEDARQLEHREVTAELVEELDRESDSDAVESSDEGVEIKEEGEFSSDDGHKRVAERREGQGEGGGDHFGGGRDHQSGSQGGDGADTRGKNFTGGLESKFQQARTAGGNAGRGFGGMGNPARTLSDEDFDKIVSAIEIGTNAHGEEVFSVTLGDDFFEGLKVQATKTPQGVVMQFICPHIQARAIFLRQRPQIYERLRSKGISVFRIDIV